MNFSKQNLRVQCRLRCDIIVDQEQQQMQNNDNTNNNNSKKPASSLSNQKVKSYQDAIRNLIQHQMRGLFGVTCGSIEFVAPTQLKSLVLHQQPSASGQRRQRTNDEDEDDQSKKEKVKEKEVESNSNQSTKVTTLKYFDITAVVERQYVQQLRAACVSCVSIVDGGEQEKMVRVTMIGAPKKYVLQKY